MPGADDEFRELAVETWRLFLKPMLACLQKLPVWSGVLYRGRKDKSQEELLEEYRLLRSALSAHALSLCRIL